MLSSWLVVPPLNIIISLKLHWFQIFIYSVFLYLYFFLQNLYLFARFCIIVVEYLILSLSCLAEFLTSSFKSILRSLIICKSRLLNPLSQSFTISTSWIRLYGSWKFYSLSHTHIHISLCVWMCLQKHVGTETEKALDTQQLQLQTVISLFMWLLET